MRIQGIISLNEHEVFDDATATVGLDDVTLVDRPSKRVAEVTIEHVHGRIHQIPFVLDWKADLEPGAMYVLTAVIRREARTGVAVGDYINTVALPWSTELLGDHIIPVKKIHA
jgi:hypothetical protein